MGKGHHPLGLDDKIWDRLSDEQKELARAKEAAQQKVEALESRILEECGKQDFTVSDFRSLISGLRFALKDRLRMVNGELFRV